MIGLSGKDNHYYTPVFSNQITFRNNLFIISATYGGDGRLVLSRPRRTASRSTTTR